MKNIKYILCAVLAAALYALNAPFSKLLLEGVPPRMMASLLYLGAGIGTLLLLRIRNKLDREDTNEENITLRDLPFVIGMIILDIAAPIFLMLGLTMTTAANASLLNNFEIVATSIIALVLFRERIGARLWAGIFFVTLASMILSFEDISAFSFSKGSLYVLLACLCWGFENNCTRSLSGKNPLIVVVLKGFFSGLGALITAFISGESLPHIKFFLPALLLGFVAYGLSITFYIYAQRGLGAARTSTYYAIAPFIGAALSLVFIGERVTIPFCIGLAVMVVGTYFASTEEKD